MKKFKFNAFTLAEVFSPLCIDSRKIAFTLAEVLITLGIIGVVAAITLPTLISKYQKHVWYNQFLKSANTLENFIKTACLLKGYEDTTTCDVYNEKILLFSGDDWQASDIALKAAPGAKIISYDDVYENPEYMGTKELNGEYVLDDHTYFVDSGMLMFADGTSVYFTDYSGIDSAIDTNGPFKGPNTIGRDIFFFWPLWTNNSGANSNGIFWAGTEKTFENSESLVPCNIDNNGFSCAGRLLKERKMNY